MIEAIQVAAMDPAQAAPAASSSMQTPQASAYEVREFAAALERTGGASAPQQNAAAPIDLMPSQPGEGTRALISAINALNGGAENINAVSMSMSGNIADITPGQMMEMTMKCHQFLFQAELTSNVANRTSDGIQQLFRQQS